MPSGWCAPTEDCRASPCVQIGGIIQRIIQKFEDMDAVATFTDVYPQCHIRLSMPLPSHMPFRRFRHLKAIIDKCSDTNLNQVRYTGVRVLSGSHQGGKGIANEMHEQLSQMEERMDKFKQKVILLHRYQTNCLVEMKTREQGGLKQWWGGTQYKEEFIQTVERVAS